MKPQLVILILILATPFVRAQDYDDELASSLKIEANHNQNRVKNFKYEIEGNRVFDEEREKGLAEFLEDQEKWDLLREKGLQDYRKEKRNNGSNESGPDYLAYLEQKESDEARYERSRQIHVRTRDQVVSQLNQDTGALEAEELGLGDKRPRYELRKRGRNKWVKSSTSTGPGVSIGGGGYTPPTDFSPAPDYIPAPAPYEPTDDGVYAPPPVYDTNTGMPYDGSSGNGEINIPPPPPPPTDFDF